MSDKKSDWTSRWMESVASGESTMSQRNLKSIESKGGGIASLRAAAKRKGIHLLLVKDDKGREIVAASKEQFKVIC